MTIRRTRFKVALYMAARRGGLFEYLPANQQVTVTETDGVWAHVVTEAGVSGWCKSSKLGDPNWIIRQRIPLVIVVIVWVFGLAVISASLAWRGLVLSTSTNPAAVDTGVLTVAIVVSAVLMFGLLFARLSPKMVAEHEATPAERDPAGGSKTQGRDGVLAATTLQECL